MRLTFSSNTGKKARKQLDKMSERLEDARYDYEQAQRRVIAAENLVRDVERLAQQIR